MPTVTNEINYTYTFDGVEKTVTSTFTVDVPSVEPSVTLTKTGWLLADGTTQWRVDLVIGDGDAFNGAQNFKDFMQEGWKLVNGTLKLDGELLDVQDFSVIDVSFEPNSVHYLEFVCQKS